VKLTKRQQQLAADNVGLVYRFARQYAHRLGLDPDEAVSDGMMALLRAVRTFDPNRGYRFSTYATRAIIRAVYSTRKRDMVQRRDHRRCVGLDAAPVPAYCEPENMAVYRDDLDAAMATLKPRERAVIAGRFGRGETLAEVAGQLRLTKERIRQIQIAAVAKLAEAMGA